MGKVRFLLWIIFLFALSVKAQIPDTCRTEHRKSEKEFDKAMGELRQGKQREALARVHGLLEKEPGYLQGYFLLAEVYNHRNNYLKAIENYKKVIEGCPSYRGEVHFELGKLYFETAQYAKCDSCLGTFLENDPTDLKLFQKASEMQKRCHFLNKMYSSPVPYNPSVLEGVSTEFDEYLPMISPDNELLFFTRRKKIINKFSVIKSRMVEEFCVSIRDNAKSSFPEGEALPPPFNTQNNEGGASLTIDNKEMFLTACNRDDGQGSCDIYFTQKKDGKWQKIRNLGSEINSERWESQVSINSKGSVLYFASDREGGIGGYDIYKVERDEKGEWGQPKNLGQPINTPGHEKSPFIHPDNNTFYFSSSGHEGLGELDIFISRKNQDGKFSDPINIGYPINSESDDLGFFVSTDGKTGYFASSKREGEGGWDIYSFPLYEGARPKQILFIKGSVTDSSGTPLKGSSVQLKNLETDEVIKIPLDSASGNYVYTQTLDSDYMLSVQKEGHFYKSRRISKGDTAASSPQTLNFEMEKVKKGSAFVMENILFGVDSYKLSQGAKEELDNLVAFMELNPSVRIAVHGHTDSINDEQSNQVLSENRAKSVYKYLRKMGVSQNRMSYKGFGEKFPLVSNESEKGRRKNRRTEVVILEN